MDNTSKKDFDMINASVVNWILILQIISIGIEEWMIKTEMDKVCRIKDTLNTLVQTNENQSPGIII